MVLATCLLLDTLSQKPIPDLTWVANVESRWNPVDPSDPSEVHIFEETGSAFKNSNGYKITRSRIPIGWEVGGQKLPVPEKPSPILMAEEWVDKELTEWVDEPTDIPSRILLRAHYVPVGLSNQESWRLEENASGMPNVSWTFKPGKTTEFLDRPAREFASTFATKDMGKGSSTITYDTKSGLPIHVVFKGERFFMPFGDGSPFSYRYEWRAKSLKDRN